MGPGCFHPGNVDNFLKLLLLIDDVVDARRRHPQRHSQLVRRHADRGQELFASKVWPHAAPSRPAFPPLPPPRTAPGRWPKMGLASFYHPQSEPRITARPTPGPPPAHTTLLYRISSRALHAHLYSL